MPKYRKGPSTGLINNTISRCYDIGGHDIGGPDFGGIFKKDIGGPDIGGS
jgi:hypothetical protein